jgi:hypothetical protein
MRIHNCHNFKFSFCSNVQVEKLGQKLTDKINSIDNRKKSLLKVKTVRFSSMEVSKCTKGHRLFSERRNSYRRKRKDSQTTSQQQSTDNCYYFVEHHINEEKRTNDQKSINRSIFIQRNYR